MTEKGQEQASRREGLFSANQRGRQITDSNQRTLGFVRFTVEAQVHFDFPPEWKVSK